MYKRNIRILGVTFAIFSNHPALVQAEEFLSADCQKKNPHIWSLLTALPAPESVGDEEPADATLYILDAADAPIKIWREGATLMITGDISRLETGTADKRWNIFGNVGLFFAFSLSVLEGAAAIHSLHASALYRASENRLLIVAGSSGSGKTVFQLEALLRRGYRVFTTEMTHFRVDSGGCTFFKGSVYDNIRVGNLLYDFPEAVSRFRVKLPETDDPWETYVPVDFGSWSTAELTLVNPQTIIVFPRIESGRKDCHLISEPDAAGFLRSCFENASEKIDKSQAMYEGAVPFASFDRQDLAEKRLQDIKKLLAQKSVTSRMRLIAGPENCWAWEAAAK